MKEERHSLKIGKGSLVLIMRQKHWMSKKVWSLVIGDKERLIYAILLRKSFIFASAIRKASQFEEADVLYGDDPVKFKRDYNKARSFKEKQIILSAVAMVSVKSVD